MVFPIPLLWNTYFKGTQAWDNFEFFWPKSNPYMPFVNFGKKFRFFSFDFCQNFGVRTFPRWLNIRGTKFFRWAIQKIFSSKIFTLVLLDGFLDDFWKFRLFIVKIGILIWYFWGFLENYSMHMLSTRGNNFIACWAYTELILSYTEHTRNKFPRMLSQR